MRELPENRRVVNLAGHMQRGTLPRFHAEASVTAYPIGHAVVHLYPSFAFVMWDVVDINDADGPSGVFPFVFVGKPFCEYVSGHFSRGSILTVYRSV